MKDKMDNQKRSRKRKLRNILIIVCALIVAAVLFMDALTLACGKRIVEAADLDDGYDCILILGAGVRDDGSPTLMLADRLDQGLARYQQGAAPKIIVSGEAPSQTTTDATAGGYTKASGGKDINFMIVHKSAVIQFPKHIAPKVITPEQNQTADAWKFGYRQVGVADVYENKTAGIYVHHKA